MSRNKNLGHSKEDWVTMLVATYHEPEGRGIDGKENWLEAYLVYEAFRTACKIWTRRTLVFGGAAESERVGRREDE